MGWTGVDMSTPLYFRIDFLIRLNSMKKVGGGGVQFFLHKGCYSFPSLKIQRSVVVIWLLHLKAKWGFRAVSSDDGEMQ